MATCSGTPWLRTRGTKARAGDPRNPGISRIPGLCRIPLCQKKKTWQIHLSTFLSHRLSLIQSDDPYEIKNSEQLIAHLQENEASVTSGFSIDIQDMYYLIPHTNLIAILRSTIEKQGTTAFQNAAGINVDTFLELLGVYLNATVVVYQDQPMVQKTEYALDLEWRCSYVICTWRHAARSSKTT